MFRRLESMGADVIVRESMAHSVVRFIYHIHSFIRTLKRLLLIYLLQDLL